MNYGKFLLSPITRFLYLIFYDFINYYKKIFFLDFCTKYLIKLKEWQTNKLECSFENTTNFKAPQRVIILTRNAVAI